LRLRCSRASSRRRELTERRQVVWSLEFPGSCVSEGQSSLYVIELILGIHAFQLSLTWLYRMIY
jgi:hypothetical protein